MELKELREFYSCARISLSDEVIPAPSILDGTEKSK